jgi:hypothetical protein
LTTQVPPLRQIRNTFGAITVTLLFLISGMQNVRLFRETWHPMNTQADGVPSTKNSLDYCCKYIPATMTSLTQFYSLLSVFWSHTVNGPGCLGDGLMLTMLGGQCVLAFASLWMFQQVPHSCYVLWWWWLWW